MAAIAVLLLATLVPTAWSARLLGQEYFANSSLVGSLVQTCSQDEKTCLTFNMLYYPQTRNCTLPWSEKGTCVYAADKCAFEGGRLVAKCHYKKPCEKHRDWELPLAYDQLCHKKTDRCNCSEGSTEPSRGLNLFGFLECTCEQPQPNEGNTIPLLQPIDGNSCTVPDFSYNIHAFRKKSSFPAKIKCNENWRNCNVSNNEGWMNGKCVRILQETPECAPGFLPMLRPKKQGRPESEVPMGKLECRRADSGCGGNELIRSALDHGCHREKLFMRTGEFHRDAFGLHHLELFETTSISVSPPSVEVNYDKLIECEYFSQRARRNRRTNGRQRRKQSAPARRPINPKSPKQRRMYSKMR